MVQILELIYSERDTPERRSVLRNELGNTRVPESRIDRFSSMVKHYIKNTDIKERNDLRFKDTPMVNF